MTQVHIIIIIYSLFSLFTDVYILIYCIVKVTVLFKRGKIGHANMFTQRSSYDTVHACVENLGGVG